MTFWIFQGKVTTVCR